MKILALLLLTSTFAFSQNDSEKFKVQILENKYINKRDVKTEIVSHDVSPLLTRTANSSVLGFIGKEYQRIRIIFISVIKNKEQPDQYFIYGKSMVRENICEFQGSLKITNAFYSNDPEISTGKQGLIIADYQLFENSSQKHAGMFEGKVRINWYIDKEGQIQYDDLTKVSDEFNNNQFVGTWTSYSGGISKPCNWGDYRIPMSGDLDNGSGDFSPNEKYFNNGWLNYRQAYGGGSNNLTAEEARKKENSPWWK